MIINVSKLAKEARVKVPDLITRPVGRKMFSSAVKKLEIIEQGETLLFDFTSIKVVDSSFIDEFIVKLILDSRGRDYFIKLSNISNISEINIDSVFNSYSNYNEDRMAVVRDGLGQNNKYYIGPLSENEGDIIDYLRINRFAGVDEISKFLGMGSAKVMDVMEGLLKLRVIRKISGKYTSV